MDDLDAGALLAHAAAFDNRRASEAANRAWAEALKDIPLDQDALDAVARYYAEPAATTDLDGSRRIQPHHVIALRRRIRDERIPEGQFTYPVADPDETGSEFVQRRRAQLRAIADGSQQAETIRELKGGPHQAVAGAIREIGRMPAHIRTQLATEAGIGKRRAQWPELAVPCPLHDCRADAWRPCRTPSGREMRQGTHPSRRDAWRSADGPRSA
jgi:hypothetical protein